MKSSALKKAEKELGKEQLKQLDIIYPACAIVWWTVYNWRETRIMRRFLTSQEVWFEEDEGGRNLSIFQKLENETGIEMSLDGLKSYHEYAYFDDKVSCGKGWSEAKEIYLRQQQKKWVAPMILASICISLHRDEGWGYERLSAFVQKVDAVRKELGQDETAYYKKLLEVTGINWRSMWKEGKRDGKRQTA